MSKVEEAAERLKTLTERPTNEELLEIYGLYKQATIGDNLTSRPGMFDMKGSFKWKAWKEKSGMSTEDAADQYVALVDQLLGKYKHS
jgi:diazepam-binding inhibitor (GABA receptor modulating acyl-CoA-binding protein)